MINEKVINFIKELKDDYIKSLVQEIQSKLDNTQKIELYFNKYYNEYADCMGQEVLFNLNDEYKILKVEIKEIIRKINSEIDDDILKE